MKPVYYEPVNLEHLIKNEIKYREHYDNETLEKLPDSERKDLEEAHQSLAIIKQNLLPNRVELRVLHQLYKIYDLWNKNQELFKQIEENLSYAELHDQVYKFLLKEGKEKSLTIYANALIEEFLTHGLLKEVSSDKGRNYYSNLIFISGNPFSRTQNIANSLSEGPKVVYNALRSLKRKKIQTGLYVNFIDSKRPKPKGQGAEVYCINKNGLLFLDHLKRYYNINGNVWKRIHNTCTDLLDLIKLTKDHTAVVKDSKKQFKKFNERINNISGKSLKAWEMMITNIEDPNPEIQNSLKEVIRMSKYIRTNLLLISGLENELRDIESFLKSTLKNFSRISDFRSLDEVTGKFEEVFKKYNGPVSLPLPVSFEDWNEEVELRNDLVSLVSLENINPIREINERLSFGYSILNRFENLLRENDLI